MPLQRNASPHSVALGSESLLGRLTELPWEKAIFYSQDVIRAWKTHDCRRCCSVPSQRVATAGNVSRGLALTLSPQFLPALSSFLYLVCLRRYILFLGLYDPYGHAKLQERRPRAAP